MDRFYSLVLHISGYPSASKSTNVSDSLSLCSSPESEVHVLAQSVSVSVPDSVSISVSGSFSGSATYSG